MRKAFCLLPHMADTTVRDFLCRVSFQALRMVLHRLVHAARRRKALSVEGLPFHMLVLDGKATALSGWDRQYCMRHQTDEDKVPHGLLRTVTASLATAPGKPCIDVTPIRVNMNEMSHYPLALGEAVRIYGDLFELVSYDAGAGSEKNGKITRKAGKHYLFRLKDERWELYKLSAELLATKDYVTEEMDVRNNAEHIRRRVRLFDVNHGVLYKSHREFKVWSHARTLIEVEVCHFRNDVCQRAERKYYISSLGSTELSASQWIFATVRHWGVETTHQILDTAFAEDDHPWIESNPNGMLAVLLLRRIAYTLLVLFRGVTLRSEEHHRMPWSELLLWLEKTLTTSTEQVIAGIRMRKLSAAVD